MNLSNIAISNRTSIFVLIFICSIAGFVSYVGLPVESFPQIEQPLVVVAVPYLGVSPADMETLVAQPIENKLDEITKVKKMTSTSLEGYTNIMVEFESDIDVDEAVRKTREKVDQAKPDLPSDVEEPIVQEISFDKIPIMLVNIVGNQSLVRLKKLAEDLQERMKQIPGVLDVPITGGLEREIQIDVIPARLKYYNIGLEDITKAILSENINIPGGSIKSGKYKYTLRIPGEFQTVEEIKKVVIDTKNNNPIYLRDIADVRFGFKERDSYARLDRAPSVTLGVQKRSGENIIQIADKVKELLEEEKANFPANTKYVILGDQSKDIRSMVNDLENNIIAGLLLVVLVLYFFMGWRNGLLVGISIPLSMFISFIIISFIGFTLNMMVLFSLILALGMLVDNAIVIIENIYRHHQQGKPLVRAAKEATAEVSIAVLTSTLTTLLAFTPLIFWPGIMGEFMSYLPITLIITLSSSLFVAFIFNPVIASKYLKLDTKMQNLPGDKLLQKLIVRYESSLRWALEHRKSTIGFTVLLYIFMFIFFIFFNHGIELFPDMEPRQALVQVEAPIGTNLDQSNKILTEIENRIENTTDLDHFVTEVGKSSNQFDFGGGAGVPHKSQITIDFFEKKDRKQSSFKTLEEIKESVAGIAEATVDVDKPEEGPPTGQAVEIQIKGKDFSVLSEISEEIQKLIKDTPGLSKLKDNYEKGRPEMRIRIEREKAALLGLNTALIANTIRTAINGTEASEYRVGQDEYDITVRFEKKYRQSYSNLMDLTIFYEGNHIPLANVADVVLASGLSSVNHVDGDRVITVSGDAFNRSGAEVLADVKEKLADYQPPAGYTLSFAGQDVEQQKAINFLTKAFFIAILLIFFVLVSQFNSVTLPFVIMISIVLSFFGVFAGLMLTFMPFGIIMTGVGIISLAGVVINNAIVLIDYIQKLRERGLSKLEAIVEGGKTRLRPVLLTAITTILGLIPLTTGINIDFIGLFKGDVSKFIQFGAESSQWWSNMGVAVIFGLFFATVLTLVVVPVLYYMMADLFIAEKAETLEDADFGMDVATE